MLPILGNRFKREPLPVVGPAAVVPAIQPLPPAPDEVVPLPPPN